MIVNANGVELYVETRGDGDPVLLLHGWPDSSALWRNQVPFLTANGFRVITPDLRGFGRSSRPEGKDSYRLRNSVAWLTAMYLPDRVRTLTAISARLGAPDTPRQREMAWEPAVLPVRRGRRGHPRARRLGRAARAGPRSRTSIARSPTCPGPARSPPRSTGTAPTSRRGCLARGPSCRRSPPPCSASGPTGTGTWTARGCAPPRNIVKGPWRYAEISGATHWIPLDAPEQLNELLLGWLS